MSAPSPISNEDVERVLKKVGPLDAFEGRTITVTGCGGFLGFTLVHVLAKAIEQGVGIRSVQLLDNFIFGEPEWIRSLARQEPRIQVRRFDVGKDNLAEDDPASASSHLFHMASIASPTHYRRYPLETIDANVWGLRRLLDAMDPDHLEGFLFFSSSEIYGDPAPDEIPTREEYRGNVASIGPRACYDEAKRFGETLCHVYATTRDLPIRIVRPFNNYGPGLRLEDRRAPADFARAVSEGRDIELHSDGSPTRTFCYVSDAVTGFIKAALHDRFDVFNIGSDGPEISILELARMFQQTASDLYGYEGNVHHVPSDDKDYLVDNPNRRCPDLSRSRQVLGYSPEVGIREGVARYIRHVQTTRPEVTT